LNLSPPFFLVCTCHKKPLITQKVVIIDRSGFVNEIKTIKLYPHLKLAVSILRFLKYVRTFYSAREIQTIMWYLVP
jgi:hypothetical protein